MYDVWWYSYFEFEQQRNVGAQLARAGKTLEWWNGPLANLNGNTLMSNRVLPRLLQRQLAGAQGRTYRFLPSLSAAATTVEDESSSVGAVWVERRSLSKGGRGDPGEHALRKGVVGARGSARFCIGSLLVRLRL